MNMARLVRLQNQIEQIKEQYFIRNRIAEDNRKKENAAATKIQSWFRGSQVRAYLRHLHRKATIIQKIWQGFMARAHFRLRVKTAYFIMKMNFYNEMAVRIQTRWRGYYVRKYIHNYYARRRYLEGLTRKNEQVRKDLEEFEGYHRRERERVAVVREEQEKCLRAQRMHFLLSTTQCPGVFNSPYRAAPDEMELRLRRTKPAPLRPKSAPTERDTAVGSPKGQSTTQRLPPINNKKPQGPFRRPLEVRQQRYRALEPTLRVATSITDLEEAREELRRQEWRGRVTDHTFQPFSNAHKSRRYEGMIHTGSPFEHAAYGTKHFREEKQEYLPGQKVFLVT